MAQLNPHINFNGNAWEAFNFYRSIFGGEFTKIIRFKDIAGEHFPVAEHEAEKLMHISLPIGNTCLMGNDVPEAMGRTNEHENRSKIAVDAESEAEINQIFQGLSAGASVEIPLDKGPDGSYYAMLRDQFGIEWILSFEPKV